MKVIIVALTLVALAAAAPADVKDPVEIVIEEFDKEEDGGFYSKFEAANGISQLMTGEVREVRNEKNEPQTIIVISGKYSYPRDDGKNETVIYYGDETGFHAEGSNLPKVPGTSSGKKENN